MNQITKLLNVIKFTLFILAVLLCINSPVLYSQAPSVLWNKTYGENTMGNEVINTLDGGFAIFGDITFGGANTDMQLIKTDANGDTMWTRNYEGGIYAVVNTGLSGIQMSDSSYIVCGYLNSELYLFRLSVNGDSVWMSTYFYPGSYYCGASAITDVKDSTFVVAGWVNIYATSDQLFLCKADTSGNIIWSKDYGATGNESGGEITRLNSGGYIVVGSTTSFGAGATDIYLLKIDENGDTLWTKTFGGAADDWGIDVLETPDQGLLILGNTQSFGPGIPNTNAYLIRTNSSGDTLWTKVYSNGSNDNLNRLSPTIDGGYILAGSSLDQIWVVKINSLGDILWTSTYDIGINEYANSIKQASDGKYIITGGLKYGASANPYNTFLLKLDSDPTGLSENVKYIPQQFVLEQNYPNPFNPTTIIAFTIPYDLTNSLTELKIYDLQGRLIKTLVNEVLPAGNYLSKWDGKNDNGNQVASGVYIYNLEVAYRHKSGKMTFLK